MSQFDWRKREGPDLRLRFAEEVRGFHLWRTLIERLVELPTIELDEETLTLEEGIRSLAYEIFDVFISGTNAESRPQECCVFVSHRTCDASYAERVAYLATIQDFDYWLDIHDPTLKAFTGQPLPSPVKEIVIASMVEIALLNCTHIVALHTKDSRDSKWIPYELGRAKSREIYSTQVCGWFNPNDNLTASAEYTHLAVRANDEGEINNWLSAQKRWPGLPTCQFPHVSWPEKNVPAKLPGS
jgi:hypothetical protein